MRPFKVCIILWTIIALLAVLCCLVPSDGWHIGTKVLRWPTVAEMLEIPTPLDSLPHSDVMLSDSADLLSVVTNDVAENTLSMAAPTDTDKIVSLPATRSQSPLSSSRMNDKDTRQYLQAFYEALGTTRSQQVRVVHYGDSQIEEDRISAVLREQLQKVYGGGGVGLIPLHQTIPTRSVRQVTKMNGAIQSTQGGPKRYIVYGPRSMRRPSEEYGVMGQVALMDDSVKSGSEDICISIEPMENDHVYNRFSQVRLLAKGIDADVCVHTDTLCTPVDSQYIARLSTCVTRCSIHLHGKGEVYGVSLEQATGVLVDNIPMRGCSGVVFTQISQEALASFFAQTNTRLIILQFGGNMLPNTENRSTLTGYVNSLRQQVRYMKQCAPDASILFIGPSDMSTRIEGELTTYPLLPYLDRALVRMAHEEEIGYWSLYQAMGERNSMLVWQKRGLAGSDYIHFTRRGADKVGNMLWDYLREPLLLNTTDTITE